MQIRKNRNFQTDQEKFWIYAWVTVCKRFSLVILTVGLGTRLRQIQTSMLSHILANWIKDHCAAREKKLIQSFNLYIRHPWALTVLVTVSKSSLWKHIESLSQTVNCCTTDIKAIQEVSYTLRFVFENNIVKLIPAAKMTHGNPTHLCVDKCKKRTDIMTRIFWQCPKDGSRLINSVNRVLVNRNHLHQALTLTALRF